MPTFVFATGKVDSEVTVRQVGEQNKKVASFRLNDGKGWYNVSAWEQLADKVPAQGSFVALQGRLNTRSYEGQSGGKVWVVEIVVSSIDSLGAAPEGFGQRPAPAGNPTPTAAASNPADDSDLFTD